MKVLKNLAEGAEEFRVFTTSKISYKWKFSPQLS